jgi:hypothetical protein
MRALAVLIGAGLVVSAGFAADPPKPSPHVTVTLVTVTVVGKEYTYELTEYHWVYPKSGADKTVPVAKVKQVIGELKGVTVTDTGGKVVPAEEVAKRFKDGSLAVVTTGRIHPDQRKMFQAGTLFFEQSSEPPGTFYQGIPSAPPPKDLPPPTKK